MISTKNQELKNCNVVKTILMFVIILYHCVYLAAGEGFVDAGIIIYSRKIYLVVLDVFSSFQNYTFVFVSGYIFSYIFWEKDGYQVVSEFVLKKAKRLLIPFIFVALVWGIPISRYYYNLNNIDILKRWALGVNPDQLWFLLMLFEVFIISRALVRLYESKPIMMYIILVTVYYIGSVGLIYCINVYRIFNTFQMLLFFRLGIDYRKHNRPFNKQIPLIGLILIYCGSLIICELPVFVDIKYLKIARLLCQLPLRITGTIIIFRFLQYLSNRMKITETKAFAFFDKLSMPIYLFHQQLIYIIISFVAGRCGFTLSVIIAFICSLAASTVISCLLMKTKYTRYLIGIKE